MKYLNIFLKLCKTPIITIAVVLLASCKQDANTMVFKNRSAAYYEVAELMHASVNKEQVIEQIVTVEGYIYEVNHLNNRNTILLSEKEGAQASVICDMQKNQRESLIGLKKGQFIAVKGILKGSLNDVILLHCILSNNLANE